MPQSSVPPLTLGRGPPLPRGHCSRSSIRRAGDIVPAAGAGGVARIETESARQLPPPSRCPPSPPRARAARWERLCWDLQVWTLQGRCCFPLGQASLTTWGEPSHQRSPLLPCAALALPAAGFTGRSLLGEGGGPSGDTPAQGLSSTRTLCFVFLGTEPGFSCTEGWHVNADQAVLLAAATIG